VVLATAFNAANGQMGTAANMRCYTSTNAGATAAYTCTVSSSTCYGAFYGSNLCTWWGPSFAADRTIQWWTPYFFFHSNYEAYPWYQIMLSGADATVTSVVMQTRCDAHAWWHAQTVEIRHKLAAITTTAMNIGGLVGYQPIGTSDTASTVCNTIASWYIAQCARVTATCLSTATKSQYLTIQQLTLDSQCIGSWWCNQHSQANRYFLMAEEFEVYGTS